ncbi:MAG: mobile mystery protein A [Gammaproteobacteria bacterium]|jgi:predicted DNA-binding mobile mystery protein A|nr:mobile mystery protein A [Gammaproteobacteria bacterium]MBT3725323.1 mobile mystery protein A [Gammaproteobacteria bacterium]MBT4076814.1 mobile mystery protein A [Gammaproteobacteria bacterium]MBT4195369.1 mobile mystery protein A [Gammaproteobacteria bacterium]MBT4449672.1 mobile mystery protein A [Gammaproteobacteria bacterium]
MSIKTIVQVQYQDIVNRARESTRDYFVPKEGWLRTVRKALNMSGVQLARRLRVTKASVSNAEKAELEGRITIKKMEHMAEGMGCKFVYFIVPEKPVNEILLEQAKKKAEAIVAQASNQMALEDQTLSNERLKFEVERLQYELLREMPSDLWDDGK